MTTHNEEKKSSKLVITFIGFNESLVMEFLNAVIDDFKNSNNIKFKFLQSENDALGLENKNNEKFNKFLKIKLNANSKIKSVFNEEAYDEYLKNIYDFTGFLELLDKYSKDYDLILNVSSGPYAWTSSAAIFGVMHGYRIYYNILTSTGTNFFKPIDTKPLRYIFDLKAIDYEIINILKVKKSCTINELHELLKMNNIKSTIRNIQYRLNELCLDGIVIKNGKKSAIYSINGILINLI